MTSTYTYGSDNPLIKDIQRRILERVNAGPAVGAESTTGIMDRPARQTAQQTQAEPQRDTQAEAIAQSVAANMAASSDNAEELADTVFGKPSMTMATSVEGMSTLRPLQEVLAMSQTELAFSEDQSEPEMPVSSSLLSFTRDGQGRPTRSPIPSARPDDLEVDFEALMAGQLRTHEGYRPYPYKDSRGLWTIGIGHLIGDGSSKGEYAQYSRNNPMPDEMVQEIFREDYQEHLDIAEQYPFWDRLDLSGKRAILDMTFNMGNLMSGWSNTMELINQGKLEEAADVIERSLYARQVGQRANTVADMLRNATIEPLAPEKSLVPRQRPNTQD
jgi:lysozyme